MKIKIAKYFIVAFAFLFIFVYVYPTLYKYDKLVQKYPIKINRLTGATHVLYGLDGWVSVRNDKPNTDAPKQSEMDAFKIEMENKFKGLKETIELDVASTLSKEVLKTIQSNIVNAETEIQSKIDLAMSDINKYKISQTDPNSSFTIGDTIKEVKRIMGPPTIINDFTSEYSSSISWFYESSVVNFENGKVTGYSNYGNNLRVK